ncbi:MAG TPA: hypothetical protein VN371_05850 [Chlorobaculum sp.]|nr:hypothetical protein [Chlorobaculum sp.]
MLFALLVAFAFAVPGAFMLFHHVMWRDEVQAWLLARDSADVYELFRNLKYEGHPGLWHLLLMPLTRFWPSPVAMQVLHLGIATMAVYVLARYAPFKRLQRALLAFGYFPFYEYSVISRNYGIGLLLIFIFCACFEKRHTRPVPIAVTLFLLSHTSAMGLIVSIVLTGALVLDFLLQREELIKTSGVSCSKYWLAFLFVCVGIALAIYQIKPPADGGYAISWQFGFNKRALNKTFMAISGAYAPVPRIDQHFWNSQLLVSNRISGIAYWCFLMVFIFLFIKSLVDRPVALFVFAGCSLGLLAFFYTKYPGSLRHHGFLFITLVMTAWIKPYTGRALPSITSRAGSAGKERLLSLLFTLVLGIHVTGAIAASCLEYRYVFSNAKRVAEYLERERLTDYIIVGYMDYSSSSVLGYLNKRQFYYPQSGRYGSFVIWDNIRQPTMPQQKVIEQALSHREAKDKGVIIILNEPLERSLPVSRNPELLVQFTGSVVGDEDYFLYLLK